MPFTKIGPDKYRSPSGRTYTESQVKLWYANGGKFPGEEGSGELPKKKKTADLFKKKK